jgi:hypothetical protein
MINMQSPLRTAPDCRKNVVLLYHFVQVKRLKSNPITGLDKPRGFQKFEAPSFQDNRHMKVVRLSSVRTGRLYSPGIIPDTHFC